MKMDKRGWDSNCDGGSVKACKAKGYILKDRDKHQWGSDCVVGGSVKASTAKGCAFVERDKYGGRSHSSSGTEVGV